MCIPSSFTDKTVRSDASANLSTVGLGRRRDDDGVQVNNAQDQLDDYLASRDVARLFIRI